jgi:hypothetical protein
MGQAVGQPTGERQERDAGDGHAQTHDARPAIRETAKAPAAHCERTQPGEDDSACYLRRATEAAESQARAARVGAALGYLQAAGLLLSLVFTGWAALSAARATKVAIRAEADAEKTIKAAAKSAKALLATAQLMKRSQQPYFDLDGWTAIQREEGGGPASLHFIARWKNTGHTQARQISTCIVRGVVTPQVAEAGVLIVHPTAGAARPTLGAGQGVDTSMVGVSMEASVQAANNEMVLLLYSRITFQNPLDNSADFNEACTKVVMLSDPRFPLSDGHVQFEVYSRFDARNGVGDERHGFYPRPAQDQ